MGAALFAADARYGHSTIGYVLGNSPGPYLHVQLEVRERMEDGLIAAWGKALSPMGREAATVHGRVRGSWLCPAHALSTLPWVATC